MNPVLLVLGGGAFAAPALRWAREAGLSAVLADPDARAPARRAASEFDPIPHDDVEAHVALARRLGKAGRIVAILAADRRAFALLPALSQAVPGVLPERRALERLSDSAELRRFLREQGLAVAEPPAARAPKLDVFAFFRDGAFVPGGLAARRAVERGDVVSVQPAGLSDAAAHAAYVLVERAARAAGLERGPLQATLVETRDGFALVSLRPGFPDPLGATHVAGLVHGKSPLQAWFAHLADAGGPFDEQPLAARRAAGWLSIAPERAGRFAGVDGVARARTLPGVVDLWIEEPGRELAAPSEKQHPLGWVLAEAHDRTELEDRLRAARAALEVRVACPQRVA